MFAAAAVGPGPYPTCGCGSPGAMKFVCGFFSAFAAEHRAMVGELEQISRVLPNCSNQDNTYFLEIESVK